MSMFPPATTEELAFAKAHARQKNSFEGCSRSTEWEVLGKLGEGTFGEVHRARNRKTGLLVAMKKIIMHNERDGFPITALREIRLLKMLSHPNVLKLEDMSIEPPPIDKKKRPNMYMITPYMDHDLAGLLENPDIHLTVPQIKCYMLQLLEGLRYLHDSLILHRDMKAANLLINNKGILQIADFGLARKFQGSPPEEGKPYGDGKAHYTGLVVTRWYRPPELLLQLRNYTPAIDVWGVGCVFGEMLTGKPILPGESDGNQLEIIWDLVGTPTDSSMPGWRTLPGAQGLIPRSRPGNLNTKFKQFGAPALSLLTELLRLDWRMRINAVDALKHPYFKQDPLPARPSELPTFEESHELDRKKFKDRRKAGGPPAVSHGVPNGGARHDGPRRPAWERGERGLPARPPEQVDANRFSRDYDRGERPRDREGRDYRHGRGQDRYVPDYGNGSGGGGGRRDWDRDRRDRDRARDRDRDRDRGSRDGGSRDGREKDYRRDDWRRRDGREGNRRTRSRSPAGYARDSYRR